MPFLQPQSQWWHTQGRCQYGSYPKIDPKGCSMLLLLKLAVRSFSSIVPLTWTYHCVSHKSLLLYYGSYHLSKILSTVHLVLWIIWLLVCLWSRYCWFHSLDRKKPSATLNFLHNHSNTSIASTWKTITHRHGFSTFPLSSLPLSVNILRIGTPCCWYQGNILSLIRLVLVRAVFSWYSLASAKRV